MSTTQAIAATCVQLRSIAISAIVPIDGWNPRTAFDDDELRALSASMAERGYLVPVLVQAMGDGSYRLVDGEKRYKAAVLAGADGAAGDHPSRRRERRRYGDRG